MRKFNLFFPLLIIFSTMTLWAGGNQDVLNADFSSEDVEAVRQNLMPLFEEDFYRDLSSDEQRFLRHYSAYEIPGTVRMGTFNSGEKKLAAYLFMPDSSKLKGTVYLLHGYLDHTLSNSSMIHFLLENDYAVLGFDFPGHGLSEGEPAAIDDFREYSSALLSFVNRSRSYKGIELTGPYIALAHSTGCSVIMETLALQGNIFDSLFDRFILTAPLVHSVGWKFTSLGIGLAEPFTDSVFRRFGGSNSNKEHQDFMENNDPLQSRTVPFSWVYAQADWFERMKLVPVNETAVFHIIQGEKDSVVDYKYNIPFLLEKYPGSQVYRFPEGGHSLFNEVPEIRDPVFTKILEIIEIPKKQEEL
jgi:alpha-beta hydrolase superfamily lysophospholipase